MACSSRPRDSGGCAVCPGRWLWWSSSGSDPSGQRYWCSRCCWDGSPVLWCCRVLRSHSNVCGDLPFRVPCPVADPVLVPCPVLVPVPYRRPDVSGWPRICPSCGDVCSASGPGYWIHLFPYYCYYCCHSLGSSLWDPRLLLPHLKEKPNKTMSSGEDLFGSSLSVWMRWSTRFATNDGRDALPRHGPKFNWGKLGKIFRKIRATTKERGGRCEERSRWRK